MATVITINENGTLTERKLTDDLEASLLAFISTQRIPGQGEGFKSIGEYIINRLVNDIFINALRVNPPAAVQAVIDKLATTTAELEDAKATALADALGK